MSIKVKLRLLVFLLVGAFALSVAVYLLTMSPVGKMESERDTLTELRNATQSQISLIAELTTARDFGAAAQDCQAGAERTTKAFLAVKGLKTLPKSSAAIRSSLAAIGDLQDLSKDFSSALDESISAVRESIVNETGGTTALLYQFDVAKDFKKIDPRMFDYNVAKLIENSANMEDALAASTRVIDKQYTEINDEIGKIAARSTLIAAAVILSIIGVVLITTLRMTAGISTSIRRIEAGIGLLKDGDLTGRFAATTSDEIGSLSSDLNTFVSALGDSMARIQGVSSANVAMKEKLIGTATKSSLSSGQIQTNCGAIEKRMSALNENLGSSTGAVEAIARDIAGLRAEIQHQMSMVEQSTASVTEMMASVENVAQIADRRGNSVGELIATVTQGRAKMAATFDLIAGINSSVGIIEEIAGMIAAIAAQTNVLAMNAAIEAANAGESGKGFSVVADEIKRVAEAAAANSKEIASGLKDIVARIGEAARAGSEATSAFQAIDTEASGLRTSLTEIFTSMAELRSGSEQILKAMAVLRDVSVRVTEGSSSIGENSEKIRDSMGTLRKVSDEVDAGMREITAGVNDIAQTAGTLLEDSERLGAAGESLNAEVSRFKTTPPGGPASV